MYGRRPRRRAARVAALALLQLPLLRLRPHRRGAEAPSGFWYAPLLAAIPPMLQDATRLYVKVRAGRLAQLCLHFDWMDGNADLVPKAQFALAVKLASFACIAAALGRGWGFQALVAMALSVLVLANTALTLKPSRGTAPRVAALRLPLHSAQPFVVLAAQRTGSNLLCGLLHQQRCVAMHNELFHAQRAYSHHGIVDASAKKRDADSFAFLEQAFAVDVARFGAVGFKAFPEHIRQHAAVFDAVLADEQVVKVVLQRRNRLAVAVSMVRAQTTGEYINANLDAVTVDVGAADLQAFISDYDAYYDGFLKERLAGQSVCHVDYEDLVADPSHQVRRVLRFIGAEYAPSAAAPMFRRQSTRPLCDVVIGFEALKAAFKGTARECDFD
ncbi:P-loop containing nucleoside triphosphate hydrolase protein [Pelagophyceae sp. CCMP2097]|nr:P-loop containing nucleoside triphosphate hydrolase protein [Pelagophyceae sp. CCMP2097]